MRLARLDHLVLTVQELERTIAFYVGVLGMREERFGEGRVALRFGDQKINLHLAGREHRPHARHPVPGSADLCLLTDTPLDVVRRRLTACGVEIVEGPVARTGACGPILSLYVRDPDGNLIELANDAS